MENVQQALDAWKHYAELSDTTALKEVLWNNQTTPDFVSELRSICWKTLLLFQDQDQLDGSSLTILRNSRAAYTSLRTHFLKAIENPSYIDETGTDPLSEDEQSLWNSLRADELVREEIWRDVERCMPDNDYFRDPRIQKYLLDVLFIWCKLNPDVGYRQGMHEILALLIWVVDTDAVDTPVATVSTAEGSTDDLGELLDARYIEHDAFSLFARVMQTAKSFYEPAQRKLDDTEAPMIVRAKYIMTELLPMIDPELAKHLQRIDVLPQIFLMRWVRLLFGREFNFSDVLEMWDLLFSEGSQLELVNYVCITMLLRIRWQLLQSDMNSALTLLLRYPPLDKTQSARALVLDARSLLHSPTLDVGSLLIIKYSGRAPTQIDPYARPSTPTVGTPPRMRGPLAMASSPASLETLLQDAAKGVMSTSERWGLNQAVRDVVGEVKRGVERNLPITDPASWSRSSSPRGFHTRNKSTKPASESHSMIAASALRKLNLLEDRNRKLAATLNKTVQDLWSFHEDLVNKSKTDGKMSNEGGQFAEKLSRSVAEVQFVQAFLQDVTLPLPDLPAHQPEVRETITDTGHLSSTTEALSQPDVTTSQTQRDIVGTGAQETQPSTQLSAAHQPPPEILLPPTVASGVAEQHEPNKEPLDQTSKPQPRITQASFKQPAAPAPPTHLVDPFLARPRLTSSSFSWMLADNNTEGQQPFSRATPFAPNEKRSHAKTGKGFLFGEDDDDDGRLPGNISSSDAAAHKSRSGVLGGATSSSAAAVGAAGRKGSKSRGKTASSAAVREREDIGLGDYGSDNTLK